MKKILSLLIVSFLFMILGISNVYAISASITKDSFTWGDVSSFDKCKLSCTNAKITGGNIQGETQILSSATGAVTLSPVSKNTTVTCKIILDKDLAGNDKDSVLAQRSITIGTTTTKKTTTTTSSKSNNNNLKALVIKDQDGATLKYTPEFKSDVYEYTVEAESNVKKVSIIPSTEHAKANVIFEPSNYSSTELEEGTTTKITIIVTAEDGTSKKSYTVNVKKAALNSDATLKSLKISEVKEFKFSSDIAEYDIEVARDVKKLTLTAVTTAEKATYKIENNKNLKNGSKVKIIVTAEDNSTTKLYTLNIIKNVSTTKAASTTGSDKDPLVIIMLSVVAVLLFGAIIAVLRK